MPHLSRVVPIKSVLQHLAASGTLDRTQPTAEIPAGEFLALCARLQTSLADRGCDIKCEASHQVWEESRKLTLMATAGASSSRHILAIPRSWVRFSKNNPTRRVMSHWGFMPVVPSSPRCALLISLVLFEHRDLKTICLPLDLYLGEHIISPRCWVGSALEIQGLSSFECRRIISIPNAEPSPPPPRLRQYM